MSNRKERRNADPAVQQARERHNQSSILGDMVNSGGISTPGMRDAGGYGVPEIGAKPAGGTSPTVNPFLIPKTTGLGITTQTFPSNFYVEWNLSTWRAACDQAMKMGYTVSYATLTLWAFQCSAFIQSLFTALSTPLDNTAFYFKDENGDIDQAWTDELCNKAWHKDLRQEILYSFFWGFSGLYFDPIQGKVYKYPMQNIDPINRMLKEGTYSFYDGTNFEDVANLLFVQPSTNEERFLGWMQSMTRAFIQINVNKNSWLQAGKRLAFPLMTVGYPQDDGGKDPNSGQQLNPYRMQAEDVVANADPSKGLVYPYTVNDNGDIVKSLEIEFEKTGANAKAHAIYTDFNENEKNEIREMILGGTLTADVGDRGSRALGEVQERKFDTMVSSKIEFVVTYMNSNYLPKIRQFYKNFPKNGKFDINRAKPMTLDDIVKLSTVVTQNGKRLNTKFFDENGISAEFLEDGPVMPSNQPGKPKDNEDENDYNMASPRERSGFGKKKY